MKCMIRCFVLSAICVLAAAGPFVVGTTVAAADGGSLEPLPVSLVALIASPRQYNGVRVYLTGFLDLAYESNAVYFHEEDFRYGMTKNAIRVTLSREQEGHFKQLSHKHVIIEGTFVADDSQSGRFSGHIVDVSRMQELQTEEEFLQFQHNAAKP
jgi:hypothetical protein